MKKNKLYLVIISAILSLVFTNANSVNAAIVTPQVNAKAGLIVEQKTGQVLADKNGNQKLPIASVSKLIVIYMVEEALKTGQLNQHQIVKISPELAKFSQDTHVANVPLSVDRDYTVKELMEMALLPSSNAAAMALADLVCGSQDTYYQKANELLDSWGIADAKIVSSSGLRNGDLSSFSNPKLSKDTQNQLSARQVAIIAKKLLDEYPQVQEITQLKTTSVQDINGVPQVIKNTDKLLDNTEYKFTGLKTGVAPDNSQNFVGITKLKGKKVITVVLNSKQKDEEFQDTISLLNQTKDNIRKAHISAKKIKSNNAENGYYYLISKNEDYFTSSNESVKVTDFEAEKVKGNDFPIEKDAKLASGELSFSKESDNDFIQKPERIHFVAEKKVNKANDFIIWWRNFAKSL
ncbi:serine hydrolase [Lactobacillus sp. YT155]|uniref:D-alanyl-D-alanine carboxypeptidase family protein n=1 Tax=Lactobacillus sp. YT155 TaxID=3060955 RepID=UPI002660352D|nr:serine hydrolase [Lactobacillus sp. YT155]MDO1605950.1 serine hydrolase [Lactobacillus sp. YT155]